MRIFMKPQIYGILAYVNDTQNVYNLNHFHFKRILMHFYYLYIYFLFKHNRTGTQVITCSLSSPKLVTKRTFNNFFFHSKENNFNNTFIFCWEMLMTYGISQILFKHFLIFKESWQNTKIRQPIIESQFTEYL